MLGDGAILGGSAPMTLVVVDYGMGNLDSVARALRRVGADAQISGQAAVVAAADQLVLPGVGAFAQGMANLQQTGLLAVLKQRVLLDKIPLLGICLGLQMLTEYGQEGDAAGLGWISGAARRFQFAPDDRLKIPHIGWNNLRINPARHDHPLLRQISPQACFYFQHSYFVSGVGAALLANSEYGHEFVAMVQHDNLVGVQFHPEKSHANGLQLLRNFVEWAGASHHA